MKILKNIIYAILLMLWFYLINDSILAFYIPWWSQITHVSMPIASNWDLTQTINYNWFKLLSMLKLILWGLFVILIVFAWAQMVWSMWENEEQLSKSKRHLWYAVVALLFINMPWTLYNAFHQVDHNIKIWRRPSLDWFENHTWDGNLFFSLTNFWYTFGDQVIGFLEVMILAMAVVVIIYESIRMIYSRWQEKRIQEARNKIVYSVLALVFIGIIQLWKTFAFDFRIAEAKNIFSNLANLALFFAWPTAFFFLVLAAYYYITWTEEWVKKAKSIVINTILATMILLASYTFLLDLSNL